MPIDWWNVGESAVLMAPTAVVSGYVGARIKAHLDRARPAVSVSSCRLASGRDLLTSRVEIPLDLTRKLRDNAWAPTLVGRVNAARVAEAIETMRKSLADSQHILAFLDDKLRELPNVEKAPAEKKRIFLDEMSREEVAIIDAVMTGGLCRQDVAPALPSDDDLKKMDVVAEFVERQEDNGGYSIHLRNKWYNLTYRDKRDNPFLLPAAKAFSVFYAPYIHELLVYVKDRVTRWAAEGHQTIDEIEDALHNHMHLVVELTIVNRGRTSVVFAPWGMLRLFGAPNDSIPEIGLVRTNPLWKPDDPIVALRQQELLKQVDDPIFEQDTGFVVDGGSTLRVTYRSTAALADLQRRIPNIRGVLAMELFLCQVCLKRADSSNGKKAWVFSPRARFGAHGERFPEQDIPLLKRQWEI